MCSVAQSHLTLCGLRECSPDRILFPWNFPGKNSGVGCHFLLRGSSRPPSPAYFSSVTQLCLTLCDPMGCTPGFPVHHELLKLAQTHIHQASDAIQPSHPLSSPSPHTFNLSQHQGLFQWVSPSHQLVKYWTFSFSISPPTEYSGLISFRRDWLDLLAVQGTLKSLLQQHSSLVALDKFLTILWPQSSSLSSEPKITFL